VQDPTKPPTWISYFSVPWVILFVVMFAVGPGSIPWFLVSELFSQGGRPLATSIAVGVNWSANFIVGLSFLPLQVTVSPPSTSPTENV
jgi:SP family facilitated glucose transporter-like MFS transporter 1